MCWRHTFVAHVLVAVGIAWLNHIVCVNRSLHPTKYVRMSELPGVWRNRKEMSDNRVVAWALYPSTSTGCRVGYSLLLCCCAMLMLPRLSYSPPFFPLEPPLSLPHGSPTFSSRSSKLQKLLFLQFGILFTKICLFINVMKLSPGEGGGNWRLSLVPFPLPLPPPFPISAVVRG